MEPLLQLEHVSKGYRYLQDQLKDAHLQTAVSVQRSGA